MKCVNIKLWDILGCFHYILNAPRICVHTIKKLLDVYFECSWILRRPGHRIHKLSLFSYLFTLLIKNFSNQQITKLAVPNYTIKQFYKVRRISVELLVKSKLKINSYVVAESKLCFHFSWQFLTP